MGRRYKVYAGVSGCVLSTLLTVQMYHVPAAAAALAPFFFSPAAARQPCIKIPVRLFAVTLLNTL